MIKLFLILLSFLFINNSFAGQNDLTSCYAPKVPAKDAVFNAELFVVVDQTTLFNMPLKQAIANSARPFLEPGSGVTVIKFSAYKMGQYTDVLTSIKLDSEIPKDMRDDISKKTLTTFDRCIKYQSKKAGHIVGNALKNAFEGASENFDKSDVLFSLKAASIRVNKSEAHKKVVLIASDMLENSSISSFYSRQAVRRGTDEQAEEARSWRR